MPLGKPLVCAIGSNVWISLVISFISIVKLFGKLILSTCEQPVLYKVILFNEPKFNSHPEEGPDNKLIFLLGIKYSISHGPH